MKYLSVFLWAERLCVLSQGNYSVGDKAYWLLSWLLHIFQQLVSLYIDWHCTFSLFTREKNVISAFICLWQFVFKCRKDIILNRINWGFGIWHINLRRLFNAKSILVEREYWYSPQSAWAVEYTNASLERGKILPTSTSVLHETLWWRGSSNATAFGNPLVVVVVLPLVVIALPLVVIAVVPFVVIVVVFLHLVFVLVLLLPLVCRSSSASCFRSSASCCCYFCYCFFFLFLLFFFFLLLLLFLLLFFFLLLLLLLLLYFLFELLLLLLFFFFFTFYFLLSFAIFFNSYLFQSNGS